jgi:hypothetical protein
MARLFADTYALIELLKGNLNDSDASPSWLPASQARARGEKLEHTSMAPMERMPRSYLAAAL